MGSNRKVTIIGAGFSGLATAYYLVRAGFQIEIFEKSARTGGLISTLRTDHGPVETAANGFLNSVLVEDLFASLNVPMQGAGMTARKRFIFRKGRAMRWPLGFVSSLRVAWFVLRFALVRSAVAPRNGDSIETWGQRVLGREACKYLLNTGLQGIYAGEPSRMSAKLILGRFFEKRAHASHGNQRKLIYHGTVAPYEGMGQLIQALESDLRAHGVLFHAREGIKQTSDHPMVIATPPAAAADFVDSERAQLLRQIEMRPVTTTTAFFESTDAKSKGFGVLFPADEAKFLGVLKNNFIFNNRGGPFSETWIRAGNVSEAQNEVDLVSERRRVFGLEEKPLESVVTNWPAAIPHYTLELERAIPILDQARDNVFLMGNYLGDLGLAKILERASRWPERLEREGKWK